MNVTRISRFRLHYFSDKYQDTVNEIRSKMKLFGRGWNNAMEGGSVTTVSREEAEIRRDWDLMRAEAKTPQERTEIDAIFSRYL